MYYDDQEDMHDHDHDTNNIPLLQCGPSTASTSTLALQVPGSYDQDMNIGYGRIPQCIPQRYKTIKHVKSVSTTTFYTESAFAYFIHTGSFMETLSSTMKFLKSSLTCALYTMSVNSRICITLQPPVIPTISKTLGSLCGKHIMTLQDA